MKKTTEDHPDYPYLQKATKIMKKANLDIDNLVGNYGDLVELHQFFSRFNLKSIKILTSYFTLNRKPLGSVLMNNNKSGKKYELFILDDVIICARTISKKELKLEWISYIGGTKCKRNNKQTRIFNFEIRKNIQDFPFIEFESYDLEAINEDNATVR